MNKPEFPKPRIMREDFLPDNETMEKYRIKKVTPKIGVTRFYPQKKIFGFFWVNFGESLGWWTSYEDANKRIKWDTKKEVVEYLPVDLSTPTNSEPNSPPESP